MRKILISKSLTDKVDHFYKNIWEERDPNIDRPKKNIENLLTTYGFRAEWKQKYLKKLHKEFDQIMRAKPSKIKELCDEFDAIKHHDKIGKKFYERIVKELWYEKLRDKEYLKFASEIDIKSCTYCNAQLTINVPVTWRKQKFLSFLRGTPKDWYGNYDLDHVLPKSKYPFLSTSFFNLIPSCPACNRSKSDSDDLKEIHLYVESGELDFIKFKIPQKSRHLYWKTGNKENIDIEIDYLGSDSDFFDKYMSTFKIQFIYDTQKDIAEELLHKKEMLTNAYKKYLKTNFDNLFPDQSLITQLKVGSYPDPKDIHKRPMTKFMQDIAEDIELIKR